MRAAACLDVADVLRIVDVADVEDAEAAKAVLAHCILDSGGAAVDAPGQPFTGDEEKIPVNRDVTLRCRAHVAGPEGRRGRIADVPDLVTVVVALDRVVAYERQVGVRDADDFLGRRSVRDKANESTCL